MLSTYVRTYVGMVVVVCGTVKTCPHAVHTSLLLVGRGGGARATGRGGGGRSGLALPIEGGAGLTERFSLGGTGRG